MSGIRVVTLDEVDPIDIGGGSWSRVMVNAVTAPTTSTTLGYSVFAPHTATSHMVHTAEELAFVVSGSGLIRLDGGVDVAVGADGACHIPAGVWHSVVNESDEPLAMVFVFASPDYPPTERRTLEPGT